MRTTTITMIRPRPSVVHRVMSSRIASGSERSVVMSGNWSSLRASVCAGAHRNLCVRE
ncbi:MAG: hypothetical protein H6Q90_6415 [Deltaproteobacteria bacterium]|nr:hypothetical protein [Deltaproteobacteria bacterium]